ncbi:MAG: hypothetical protein ABIJ97_17210 [Bacteroidota bacterium]
MKADTLKTKTLYSIKKGEAKALLHPFNLPVIIEKIKQKQFPANGELNATILLKSSDCQIALIALQGGTKIKSFQSLGSISFQIFEGKLNFHIKKESLMLDKDQILTLDEKIKYSYVTNEMTVFLLTIIHRTSNPLEN